MKSSTLLLSCAALVPVVVLHAALCVACIMCVCVTGIICGVPVLLSLPLEIS